VSTYEWYKIWGLDNYIQPGKPAQNGFVERFNRTYREDVLDAYLFHSLDEVRKITFELLEEYNSIRPHASLGNLTPYEFAANLESVYYELYKIWGLDNAGDALYLGMRYSESSPQNLSATLNCLALSRGFKHIASTNKPKPLVNSTMNLF